MATQETRPGKAIRQAYVRTASGETSLQSEAILPTEVSARSLQRVFVEILAIKGVPWETAFRIADVAWDINQALLVKREKIAHLKTETRVEPPALSEGEQRQRDARSREIWSQLEANPEFKEDMRRAEADMEAGYHYSWELIKRIENGEIPKLRVVDPVTSEAFSK